MGEPFQVRHDLPDTLRALQRLPEEVPRVRRDGVQPERLPVLSQVVPVLLNHSAPFEHLLVPGDDVEEPLRVLFQRLEVARDEGEGVVDLVRDPRGQLADGGHLLLLDQLRHGAGEFLRPLPHLDLQGPRELAVPLLGRRKAPVRLQQFLVGPVDHLGVRLRGQHPLQVVVRHRGEGVREQGEEGVLRLPPGRPGRQDDAARRFPLEKDGAPRVPLPRRRDVIPASPEGLPARVDDAHAAKTRPGGRREQRPGFGLGQDVAQGSLLPDAVDDPPAALAVRRHPFSLSAIRTGGRAARRTTRASTRACRRNRAGGPRRRRRAPPAPGTFPRRPTPRAPRKG